MQAVRSWYSCNTKLKTGKLLCDMCDHTRSYGSWRLKVGCIFALVYALTVRV